MAEVLGPKLLMQARLFWLGYQGQLKVAGLISETGLLMTWDKDWLERIRKLLELKPAGLGSICHNEFSGEMWGVVLGHFLFISCRKIRLDMKLASRVLLRQK
jgi:hypothetical protein